MRFCSFAQKTLPVVSHLCHFHLLTNQAQDLLFTFCPWESYRGILALMHLMHELILHVYWNIKKDLTMLFSISKEVSKGTPFVLTDLNRFSYSFSLKLNRNLRWAEECHYSPLTFFFFKFEWNLWESDAFVKKRHNKVLWKHKSPFFFVKGKNLVEDRRDLKDLRGEM